MVVFLGGANYLQFFAEFDFEHFLEPSQFVVLQSVVLQSVVLQFFVEQFFVEQFFVLQFFSVFDFLIIFTPFLFYNLIFCKFAQNYVEICKIF